MRRLLGAHLPAASPERRETVAGECLGCQTQFVIDVRLPLPATCPDCGADVLASADIKGEAQPRLPFDRAHSRFPGHALTPHRRHGHPLQTVPSAGLIERTAGEDRVDALR